MGSLNVFFAAGLGISASSVVYGLYLLLNRSSYSRIKKLLNENVKIGSIKEYQDQFLREAEKRLQKSGLKKIKLLHYLAATGLLVIIALMVGFFYMKNPIAALAMATSAVLLPEHLIFRRGMALKYKKENHFVSVVKVFISEFAINPQVERGFAAVGKRCPEPLGSIFRKAYKSLISGVGTDKVYVDLLSNLDFLHGHMFVHIIKAGKTNSRAVIPLLNDLITKMTLYMTVREENINQVRGESLMSLAIAIAPLPAYLVVRSVVPETTEFLRETLSGRLLVFGIFFSSVLWLLLNRVLESVEA